MRSVLILAGAAAFAVANPSGYAYTCTKDDCYLEIVKGADAYAECKAFGEQTGYPAVPAKWAGVCKSVDHVAAACKCVPKGGDDDDSSSAATYPPSTTPAGSTTAVPIYSFTTTPASSTYPPQSTPPSETDECDDDDEDDEVSKTSYPTTTAASTTQKSTTSTYESTIYTTVTETETSCAPTVTSCPGKTHVSSTVVVVTTVCPVDDDDDKTTYPGTKPPKPTGGHATTYPPNQPTITPYPTGGVIKTTTKPSNGMAKPTTTSPPLAGGASRVGAGLSLVGVLAGIAALL